MSLTKILISIFLFYTCVLGVHFGLNDLLNLNYWNNFTPWLYSCILIMTAVCIPLLATIKRKDAKLFVQGFLAFTVLQFLAVITAVLVVVTLYPDKARNFAAQLLFLAFLTLVFQSIVLAKIKIAATE